MNALNLGRCPTLGGIAFQQDVVVLLRAHKAKRPGADRMFRRIAPGAFGNYAERWPANIREKAAVRLTEVNDKRGSVGSPDGLDEAERTPFGSRHTSIQDR